MMNENVYEDLVMMNFNGNDNAFDIETISLLRS